MKLNQIDSVFVSRCMAVMLMGMTAVAMLAADNPQELNEMLLRRSRFSTGGVAMLIGIVAMLVLIMVNNRWGHRMEVKNRQLEREHNVVMAQNRQLAIERDRAEAGLRAKAAFLRNMTHEIRTPLNAISGFTQVLTMGEGVLSEAERHDMSMRIQENTHMLTNILDDLILIAEMEGDTELPPSEACSVQGLLLDAESKVRPMVKEGVMLGIQCNMADDSIVSTYPRQIRLILDKVLDNAAKFTTAGSITLTLDEQDGNLCFAVADTGPGIPDDKQEFIFERFTKLDSFSQGTGLGLSIARMLAEHLGGTLTLDSRYRGGAKFNLVIPVDYGRS